MFPLWAKWHKRTHKCVKNMDYIIVCESPFYFNFVIMSEKALFVKLEPGFGMFNVNLLISCLYIVAASCGKLCVSV